MVAGIFEGQMNIECPKTAVLLFLIVTGAATTRPEDLAASVSQKTAGINAVRMIQDPHTSMCWILQRDPIRPGGPGRMVLLNQLGCSQSSFVSIAGPDAKTNANISSAVIRSGDRVVVEEKSAIVEARLEAVAMGSAAEGAELNVRLAIGGKVLRAVAIGPGRAALASNARRP
jgi:hypothetical protein